MEIVYSRCAGLDVHKKTVVACAITPKSGGGWNKEIKTFGTMTNDLLQLSDWLTVRECTHVAMESTGEYWRPIFNILEANFEVLLVNAHHITDSPHKSGNPPMRLSSKMYLDGKLIQRMLNGLENC
nr:transposase [Anabaena lutea]